MVQDLKSMYDVKNEYHLISPQFSSHVVHSKYNSSTLSFQHQDILEVHGQLYHSIQISRYIYVELACDDCNWYFDGFCFFFFCINFFALHID